MSDDIVIRCKSLSKAYNLSAGKGRVGARVATMFRHLTGLLPPQSHPNWFWALDGLNLEIRRGDVVGIIGRNGAGKSTLLKILSRVTAPTAGDYGLKGKVCSMLEVGTGFHPDLTGIENIYLNGSILGLRRNEIKSRMGNILEFAEIGNFAKLPVRHYSSGMYVRLAFAVAANLDPDILIVDEVLAVGDARFQNRCQEKMKDANKGGRTILFVSHNLSLVTALCSRAIQIDAGKLIADGSASEVVGRYLAGDGETCARRVYDPPVGSTCIKIMEIALITDDGRLTPTLHISDDVRVRIIFDIVNKPVRPRFSLYLTDSSGVAIFSSVNVTDPEYNQMRQIGRYCATCVIPGGFLNAGRFCAYIFGANDNWDESFRVDLPAVFDTLDDGSSRGDFPGTMSGITRPHLQWTTAQGLGK